MKFSIILDSQTAIGDSILARQCDEMVRFKGGELIKADKLGSEHRRKYKVPAAWADDLLQALHASGFTRMEWNGLAD